MSITINKAVYGTPNKGIDVTQICQNIVNSSNDDITANNATFTDPDPGNGKYFAINYTNPAKNNGSPITLGCSENSTLDLVANGQMIMPPPPPAVQSVTIVQALFGSANQGWDVTQTCQWLVSNGATAIQVNIGTFGDPDPGNLKTFSIVYTAVGGGKQYLLACQENTTLNLPTS